VVEMVGRRSVSKLSRPDGGHAAAKGPRGRSARIARGAVCLACVRPRLCGRRHPRATGTYCADPELRRYPHLQQFVERIALDRPRSLRDEDQSLAALLVDAKEIDASDRQFVRLTSAEVYAFFEACVEDKLTMLRANGLLARLVNWSNVVVVIDGGRRCGAEGTGSGCRFIAAHATCGAFCLYTAPGSQAPFLCGFWRCMTLLHLFLRERCPERVGSDWR